MIIRGTLSFALVKWQEDNVLSVRNDSSEGKTLSFEIGEHWSAKKESKASLSYESQQYIYHHGIEEECRELPFRVTVFPRVTSNTYCKFSYHPVFEQFC